MWTIQVNSHGTCGSCHKKCDTKPLDSCEYSEHKIAYDVSLKRHRLWRSKHRKLLSDHQKQYLAKPTVKANRVKLAAVSYSRRKRDYPSNMILNQKFSDSHLHHLTPNICMFIPKLLHQSVQHDLRQNTNMEQINELAMIWEHSGYPT